VAYDTKTKDPDAVKDYLNDWQSGDKPFLLEDEIITASTWTAYAFPVGNPTVVEWEPTTDLTIDSDSFTDTTATVWLSGGTVGDKFLVTNHVTTDQGREDDWTIQIKIREQ
jgi:hypothetical protein